MAKEIKYGMVGGSIYAFIGEVHRKALAFDTRAELVAGCFSNVESENIDTAKAYGVSAERTYKVHLHPQLPALRSGKRVPACGHQRSVREASVLRCGGSGRA